MLIVTAAIIEKDDKILITQRKEGKHGEFLWEFPGGKLEEGEAPEDCIIREIYEELNINIEVIDIFDVVYHRYEKFNLLMLVYMCRYLSGEIKANEVEDFKWIDIKDINKFEFLEADIGVVNKLIVKKM